MPSIHMQERKFRDPAAIFTPYSAHIRMNRPMCTETHNETLYINGQRQAWTTIPTYIHAYIGTASFSRHIDHICHRPYMNRRPVSI